METGIIYKYTNKLTGECYIGQTIHPESRKYNHLLDALKHSTKKFSNAILNYGAMNFTYEVLERCPRADLSDRENFWMQHFDSIANGYNMIPAHPSKPQQPPKVRTKKDYSVPRIPDHLKHLPLATPLSDEDMRKIYAGTFVPPARYPWEIRENRAIYEIVLHNAHYIPPECFVTD